MAAKRVRKTGRKIAPIIAVVLAIVAIGGASLAYLFMHSETVINFFEVNTVDTDVDESTGDQYKIIPGYCEKKDPQVSVDVDVNSYAYVLVYEYNPVVTLEDGTTTKVISWSIAEGWDETPIITFILGEDGYTPSDPTAAEILSIFGIDLEALAEESGIAAPTAIYVYAREVAADTETSYDVLAGNVVSYNKLLTQDLIQENQPEIGTYYVAFASYVIQSDIFGSAYAALIMDDTYVITGDSNEMSLSANKTMTAEELIAFVGSENCTIVLNGYTLTIKNADGTSAAALTEGSLAIVGPGTVSGDISGNVSYRDGVTFTTASEETETEDEDQKEEEETKDPGDIPDKRFH